MTIQIDTTRAEALLAQVHSAFQDKKGLFERIRPETHAPQHVFIPRGLVKGGPEHVLWLFFAALTDRRQVSVDVYRAHVEIKKIFPHLYTEEVLLVSVEDMIDVLIRYKVGVPRQSATYWLRCAQSLFGEYGGNPLEIYVNCSTINEVLIKIKKGPAKLFPGFGPKILSLYGLFLNELGFSVLEGGDAFPVDVHVQRFFLVTDCVQGDGQIYMNDEMEKVIRPFLGGLCKRKGWNWVDLSHALWFLGNSLCNGCYRNRSVCFLCPVYNSCGGNLDAGPYFKKGYWDLSLPRYRRGGDMNFNLASGSLFSEIEPA